VFSSTSIGDRMTDDTLGDRHILVTDLPGLTLPRPVLTVFAEPMRFSP
jgi:hypothetical protein